MTNALALLEELGKSHERMAELADRLDWDGVIGEWNHAYPKIVALKALQLDQLPARDRAEATRQIAQLLAVEERLSGRIAPWLDQVRPLLETFRKYPLKPENSAGG